MGSGCSSVQEPCLSQQESANAYCAQPAYFDCLLLQPHRQSSITHRSARQPANKEHRVARPFNILALLFRDEGQDATLALHGEGVCTSNNFNCVNGSARKTIHRVEHLERPDQIQFINGRYDNDDDPAA
jgi:hypothetical protein